jgi:hypothetical protein
MRKRAPPCDLLFRAPGHGIARSMFQSFLHLRIGEVVSEKVKRNVDLECGKFKL